MRLAEQCGDVKSRAEAIHQKVTSLLAEVFGAESSLAVSKRDQPVWLDATSAAARAQVGRRIIYAEVTAGRLKAARVGGRRELRFRIEWVDTWLEAAAQPIDR